MLLLASPSAYSTPEGRADLVEIKDCNQVELEFGRWTLSTYERLRQRTSDRGGKIDQSLVTDFFRAMPTIKNTVHERIQQEQRIRFDHSFDRGPKVENCRRITQIAKDRTNEYLRELILELHPSDRDGRRALFDRFRVELREATSEPFMD